MPTINEDNCCGCSTPPPCETAFNAVIAFGALPGAPAINPWGTYSWPAGGDTALLVQDTFFGYNGFFDAQVGDDRAGTRYLQIDEAKSSENRGSDVTYTASATRTRKFDPDTGQCWYSEAHITRQNGTSDDATWTLDVATGNVTTTGTGDPDGLWVSVDVSLQSIDPFYGTNDPAYDSMTITVGATSVEYDFTHSAPDDYSANHREVTLSSPRSLATCLAATVGMLDTIDLTDLTITYTFDDSTTHTVNTFTQLYWAPATVSPAAGKEIKIHDPGSGWQRAEKSVMQAAKTRHHVCYATNLLIEELTAPVPNSAGPGLPDNGSAQHLSGDTDCTTGWAAADSTHYVNPSDITFTWGYATPGGC